MGWSQVVWLGNGHKAVTVQGPRRPLLRSVLCSILILGLLPPPPVADQPLTSSPTSPATALQRPTSQSTATPQRPGCSQNCSSSLSRLLSARISTFASINSCCVPTPNINSFSPLLNSMLSRCLESESPTLRTEATTMSTLGSRLSLTSLRFLCNEA